MNEEQLLDKIFNEEKMWKEKYPISWCSLCECAIISCPEADCHASSCNCGSCPKCHEVLGDFSHAKDRIQDYFTAEENKVLEKAFWLKRHILESLARGEYTIDWKWMLENGRISERAEEIFAKEIAEYLLKHP
jgi:hypothetical protein